MKYILPFLLCKVTRFVGVVPKGQDVYVTNTLTQNTKRITDDKAFQRLDAAAKYAYRNAKSSKPTNEMEYTTSMVTNENGKPIFVDQRMMLREINGYEDFLNELRYRSDEYKANPSMDTVHYRFGSFVVSMSLNNFYLKVDGVINTKFSFNDLQYIKSEWPDVNKGYSFSEEYRRMIPETGADFIQHVRNWIYGGNGDIETTPANFIEHAYNAQCGAAMFMSESIRNFHNHLTNMWVLG